METLLNLNLAEIGLFFVGFAYVFTYWKKGGNQASTEVINALKEQHQINADKISQLTKEVGILTGQLKEKNDRITMLESIVQGKNPEQIQYMADMRRFTEGVSTYMADSIKTLGEISIFMHNLNNKDILGSNDK
jgi:beta-N-acetylglucosaminidase